MNHAFSLARKTTIFGKAARDIGCARLRLMTAGLLTLMCLSSVALADDLSEMNSFSFGVIGHPFRTTTDEATLRAAISQTDDENLAFVVTNGIKSEQEPCSDKLYQQRKVLLNGAKNGLIVSPSASDWVGCKNESGRSTSFERLNRLRELFFGDDFSLGDTRIPLNRQSTSPKFRSYVENARWEIGNVTFATINLPARNNHYTSEGGRNSEFEDRLIANKEWLQRILIIAEQKKSDGIVLFCDGDPLAVQRRRVFDFNVKRDGYVEIRHAITALAAKFSGKVLIIHGPPSNNIPSATDVVWKKNLGDMEIAASWAKVTVNAQNPYYFAIDKTRN